MLVVVESYNRHIFRVQMEQLWRRRYEIFVEELGWPLNAPDGRERDEFDHDGAVYLLALDDHAELIGGARLIPTTRPYMIAEHFADLLDGPPPRSQKIWEISRVFVIPEYRSARNGRDVHSELVAGWFEYGLKNGIESFVFMVNERLRRRMKKDGHRCRSLGPIVEMDGHPVFIGCSDVSKAQIRALEASRGIQGPYLTNNFRSPSEEELIEMTANAPSHEEMLARVAYALNDLNGKDAEAIVELIEMLARECIGNDPAGGDG